MGGACRDIFNRLGTFAAQAPARRRPPPCEAAVATAAARGRWRAAAAVRLISIGWPRRLFTVAQHRTLCTRRRGRHYVARYWFTSGLRLWPAPAASEPADRRSLPREPAGGARGAARALWPPRAGSFVTGYWRCVCVCVCVRPGSARMCVCACARERACVCVSVCVSEL